MVDITAIHIHYRDKRGKMRLRVIEPTDPESTLAIKKDVAKVVTWLKTIGAEYYYAVVEIDRDGTPGYRTIIPKIEL